MNLNDDFQIFASNNQISYYIGDYESVDNINNATTDITILLVIYVIL